MKPPPGLDMKNVANNQHFEHSKNSKSTPSFYEVAKHHHPSDRKALSSFPINSSSLNIVPEIENYVSQKPLYSAALTDLLPHQHRLMFLKR